MIDMPLARSSSISIARHGVGGVLGAAQRNAVGRFRGDDARHRTAVGGHQHIVDELRVHFAIRIEHVDQDRLGPAILERGQVRADLVPDVFQPMARGADLLKALAAARRIAVGRQRTAIGLDDVLPAAELDLRQPAGSRAARTFGVRVLLQRAQPRRIEVGQRYRAGVQRVEERQQRRRPREDHLGGFGAQAWAQARPGRQQRFGDRRIGELAERARSPPTARLAAADWRSAATSTGPASAKSPRANSRIASTRTAGWFRVVGGAVSRLGQNAVQYLQWLLAIRAMPTAPQRAGPAACTFAKPAHDGNGQVALLGRQRFQTGTSCDMPSRSFCRAIRPARSANSDLPASVVRHCLIGHQNGETRRRLRARAN